jgi:tetratricopeptide (TPR) repeat protein
MLMRPFRMARLWGPCLLAFVGCSTALADQLTDEALALLNGGQGRAAYTLLEPRESERAGEVDYDFLLGLAALEVGENTRAVFALERVLALDPAHIRARAEIARAYLALGEVATARQEFENVQRQGVPADVSLTLERYIALANRLESGDKASLNGYVEAQFGYDSNVNAGPNRSSITFPSGFSIPLPAEVKANEDGFGQIGAGINGKLPLASGLSLLAGLSGSYRSNFEKSQFNLGGLDANLGLVLSVGKNVVTVMGQAGQVTVDGVRYRNIVGATGQWQYNLDARNQLSAFGQYAQLNYLTNRTRDVDRYLAGASYAHMWRDGAVGFVSAYLVQEKPEANNAEEYDFDGYGMRFGGRFNLAQQAIAFAGVSYERRDYSRNQPDEVRRQDDQYGALVGVNYALSKDWTLTPQLTLTFNKSNLELNDYHREVVSIAIRREF